VADDVMNPGLLWALARTFPSVAVHNAGRPLKGYYAADPYTGRRRLRVFEWGESYAADCPFCNDTRGRLSVNNRYGVRDPETGHAGYELWKCFNEECQGDRANRDRLRDMLSLALMRHTPVSRRPIVKPAGTAELTPVEFPGVLVPLTELPGTHHALAYLKGRGFDPDELSRVWKVGYAEHVPPKTRGAYSSDRIIIPVHDGGVMVGWQARYVGEVDWKATGTQKYLTYYPKSMCLYGLDEAENEDTLVIVEGVTSVWRYGFGALPLLGKTISATQVELLMKRGRARPLVLVPDADDPDSLPAFRKVAAAIESAGYEGPIGYAPLPPGTDPAGLSRRNLRRLVAAVVDCITGRPTSPPDQSVVPQHQHSVVAEPTPQPTPL
jgi:hypothetical protein